MDLSIVSTLYRSAPYLDEFTRRIVASAEAITPDFEIVLVNDGSPDESLAKACSLVDADPRIRVIDLSRNFGHHRAIMTGLAEARGEMLFLIDCDLEEDPELLAAFTRELSMRRVDVIYGVRERREGPLFDRISSVLFFRIFNALSDYRIPDGLTITRLMTRRYVDSLVLHRDRELFLAGLWALTGFDQSPYPVRKRHKPTSTYSLQRKVAMVVDAITAFSARPLELIFYLGLAISFVSTLAALVLVAGSLISRDLQPGWPSLMVSVWLLGGITILCLGLLGMYVSKIYVETKDRPYTIVRGRYERSRRDSVASDVDRLDAVARFASVVHGDDR